MVWVPESEGLIGKSFINSLVYLREKCLFLSYVKEQIDLINSRHCIFWTHMEIICFCKEKAKLQDEHSSGILDFYWQQNLRFSDLFDGL